MLVTCIVIGLAYAPVRGLQQALHTFQLAKALISKDHSAGECCSRAILAGHGGCKKDNVPGGDWRPTLPCLAWVPTGMSCLGWLMAG